MSGIALDTGTLIAIGGAVVVGGAAINIGSQLIVKFLTESRNGKSSNNKKNDENQEKRPDCVSFEELTKYCAGQQAIRSVEIGKQFEPIERRLEVGDKKFDQLSETVVETKNDVKWIISILERDNNENQKKN